MTDNYTESQGLARYAHFDPSISRTRIHITPTDEGYHRSVRAELYCLNKGDYKAARLIREQREGYCHET